MPAISPLSSPDLLALFVKTAEHGSIAAGARALNMSPSLATRKIAQLEAALHSRLFERTTRSSRLTEAGAIALEWASRTLDAQLEVADRLAALQGNPSGLIRVVSTNYAGVELLPEVLARFSRSYPGIRLSLNTTDSWVNLVEHSFDVAVHSGLVPETSLVGQRVQQFERVLCATPAYVARKGVPASPQSLAQHDCLVHSVSEPRTWYFMRGKKLLAQPIEALVQSDNHAVLLKFAKESTGIVRLAHTLVKEDIAAGRLVRLLPEYKCVHPGGDRPGLWVLYPSRRVLHRTRLLIDHLIRNLQEEAISAKSSRA
jgi:DNA-binding transcriptional LysR family regulator